MCLEAGRVLDAYIDNELQPADASDLRTHLALCTGCRALLADREELCRLLRHLPYYPASDHFRAKVARTRTHSRLNQGLLAWAAVLTLAVSVGSVGVGRLAPAKQRRGATAAVADEVVDDHARALKDAHLFDVRSSDQHTVKPWFLGKLDFSPPVEDLAPAGFPLVGGRLDHVAGQHPINLYIWPVADRTAPSDIRSIRGFQVRHWIRNDLSFWAVSDLADAELGEFVRALQR
jgi:anti-sigma factor RsiW